MPHSVSLNPGETDTIIMDGPKKLAEYIKYREDRIAQLQSIAEQMCQQDTNQHVSREQLY